MPAHSDGMEKRCVGKACHSVSAAETPSTQAGAIATKIVDQSGTSRFNPPATPRLIPHRKKIVYRMKSCLPLSLLAAAALAASASTAHAQTNLLFNGDFSTPALTGTNGYASNPTGTYPDSVSVPGWSLSDPGEGVDSTSDHPFGPNYYAPDSYVPGTQENTYPFFAFIQGTGTITQTVTLIGGDNYTLSYAAAQRVENNTTAAVNIDNAGGTSIAGETLNQPATNFITEGFTPFSFSFTPITSGTYSVVLASAPGPYAQNGDQTQDFTALDLEDVTPLPVIPEPSTYALLGLGALALCFVGRHASLKA